MSENRISGNDYRFNQNDFVIDTRKGTKSCQDLSEPSQESFCNSSGIDQGCRSPIIHYTSSGTCKDSVKISSTTTNPVSKGKNELSVSNNINPFPASVPIMKKPGSWFLLAKCVKNTWDSNIRGMVRRRENLTHKCAELLAIEFVLFSFTKGTRQPCLTF